MTPTAQMVFMILKLVLASAPGIFQGLSGLVQAVKGQQSKSSAPVTVADIKTLADEHKVDLEKVVAHVNEVSEGPLAPLTSH